MTKLTAEQLSFLKSQKIDLSLMFEVPAGMPRKVWPAMMKKLGKSFAYGDGITPCEKAGHTVRNRKPGHCIQCNTSVIAYGTRHTTTGRLYILGSANGRRMKIGMTDDDLEHRVANICRETYGGFDDWKLLAVSVRIENAGAVEHAAQADLSAHRIEGSSNRGGKLYSSKEIFACGFSRAYKALSVALSAGPVIERRCRPNELARYEWEKS